MAKQLASTPSRPRLALLTCLGALVALGLPLLHAAPAQASAAYLRSSFEAPSDGGFNHPVGIGIDESAGILYVADSGQNRILKFELSGTPALFSSLGSNVLEGGETPAGSFNNPMAVAADPATHTIFVTDYEHHVIDEFNGETGRYTAQLNGTTTPQGTEWNPGQLRVDPKGNLWVTDSSHALLDEFDSVTGELLRQIDLAKLPAPAEPLEQPFDVSVDATGNIYVDAYNAIRGGGGYYRQADKLNSSGALQFVLGGLGGGGTGIALDTSSSRVFINTENDILEYNAFGGALISTLGASAGVYFQSIAVDSATHTVYATDYYDGRVYAWSPVLHPQALTVEKSGSGSGEVAGSAPPELTAINCGSTCMAEYEAGNEITLTATPDEHAAFTGWSGCDEVPSPAECKVDMSAAKQVTAQFSSVFSITPPSNLEPTSATLNGHLNPALVSGGKIASCEFEYVVGYKFQESGFAEASTVPCSPPPPAGGYSSETDVSASITNLQEGFTYHVRLAASYSSATHRTPVSTFAPPQAPSIEGFSSSHLTATTADLNAQINPDAATTTYHFEYGTTIALGSTAPVPDGEIAPSNTAQNVTVELENLQRGTTYHFRVVAENLFGSVRSEDQTFNFFPPSCPNQNVRQQTQANYLPDCRAYELVSASDAGGTRLYAAGPSTGLATSPSRFSYVGALGAIPEAIEAGGKPIDGGGDLYVATRTDSGWVSRYVGIPANQAAVAGGPPEGLPGVRQSTITTNTITGGGANPSEIETGVLTDPSMDTFFDWNGGLPNYFDLSNPTPMPSNAPYVWSADGTFRERLPSNLNNVEPGLHEHFSNATYEPLQIEPGGIQALDCPLVTAPPSPNGIYDFRCPGDLNASADLSHFVFTSGWNVFAPEGQLGALGSVYDNNRNTGTVEVASKLPGGAPIPAIPPDLTVNPYLITGTPLQIPAVSSDGSHILMATSAFSECQNPHVGGGCPPRESHLYMRVNGAVTYDISEGNDHVTFLGMTHDGSKVYFTSKEHLTHEDEHHGGTSLFMWSQKGAEEGHPLTLISKPETEGSPGEPGNTEQCGASWIAECGVETYAGVITSGEGAACIEPAQRGGNCLLDNFIAENGDIYFFSPEQLDGTRGIPGQENLYDYREGKARYVTTLKPEVYCTPQGEGCTNTPIARMQITPTDSYMAFVTASQVTGYENNGHLEMYRYETATGKLLCVSCIPSGSPPTSDVKASQDGLFMTNDGRTFFSTDDALVSTDTNQGEDVYEYVDGRPQLITPGTGASPKSPAFGTEPGLVGVSANGTDVYFGTTETLVSQDHNGQFPKFYDARSDGGFPVLPPAPPCDAADECHGQGSSPPTALSTGTEATLSGGNGTPAARRKRRTGNKHHKRRLQNGHRPTRHADHGGRK